MSQAVEKFSGSADDTVPVLHFNAVLHAHRSLPKAGFFVVMTGVALISFVAGCFFMLHGAWPVFGFFGLDVLLLSGAFHLSYRSGREREIVQLGDDALTVTRIAPSGRQRHWSFQPYWVRVDLPGIEDEDPLRGASRLGPVTLSSHGRSLALGRFLGAQDRRAFHAALSAALQKFRTREF